MMLARRVRDARKDLVVTTMTDTRRRIGRLAASVRRHVPDRSNEVDYLFIMTYGRSGSTLVQGILNSIPGYLIRGENRDSMDHLFRFHQTCVKEVARVTRADGSKLRVTHPFYGMDDFPPSVSLDHIRRLATATVLRPERDTRVTGFKEIRWYKKDLPEYVAFLREVFPGARFLVNTRDHEAVLASKFWRSKPRDGRLERNEESILAVAADLGDAAFQVHFDDYVKDPDSLVGLFNWLGEPYDAAAVRRVMSVRHSY
jgi:hypothetical protein